MNKVIAIYLGPSGLALIGQFQSFSGIVTAFSNGSIQTGLVKKTAESDVPEDKESVWVNALLLSIGFSVFTSLIVFTMAGYFAKAVMFDVGYTSLMQFFSCSIIFYSLNLFVLSILNGLGDIRLYSIVNIFVSFFSLLVVSLLTIFYQLKGALIGLIITQSLVFLMSYLFIYKRYKNLFFNVLLSYIDKKIIITLLKYGVASFSNGVIVAFMMIFVRNIITDSTSLNEAGIWEAGIKIGIYFNLLFALPISIHYLPEFSKVKDGLGLKSLIMQAIVFVLPLMIVTILGFYLFSDVAISILFSDEFLVLSKFLMFILLAEIVRVISGVFSTLLFAKQLLMVPVKNELLRSSCFVVVTFLLMDVYELQGVALAYLLSSFLYLVANFLDCRKFLHVSKS